MNIRTKEIYSEVYSILNMLGEQYISKLPQKLYLMLEKEKSNEYNPQYNSNIALEKQKIKKESLAMISLFHLNYWCDSNEEKEKLKQIFKTNEETYQQRMREKYNPDNIFNKQKNVNETTSKNNTGLIEYKESFLSRIRSIILKLLHINKDL